MNNRTKLTKIRYKTDNGLAETIIKKRHLTEGLYKDGKRKYLFDIYGCKVYTDTIECFLDEFYYRRTHAS